MYIYVYICIYIYVCIYIYIYILYIYTSPQWTLHMLPNLSSASILDRLVSE